MGACVEPTHHLATSLDLGSPPPLLATDVDAAAMAYPPAGGSPVRLVSSPHKAAGDDDEPSGSHYYLRHLQAAEEPPVRDPIGEGTADAWVERSPSLLRLTGRHPFNGEPPLPLLMRHGFVTPARCTQGFLYQ